MTDIEIVQEYMKIPPDRITAIKKQLRTQAKDNAKATILRYIEEMNVVIGCPIDVYSREQKFVDARMVLSYVLTNKGFTYAKIGAILGKDHSTIIHLKNAMEFDVDHKFKTSAFLLLEKYEKRLKEYGI